MATPIDKLGGRQPSSAVLLKLPNQFPLFGVYTDDRQVAATKAITEIGDVVEQGIVIGAGVGSQLCLRRGRIG
jgi:hypothetical protein